MGAETDDDQPTDTGCWRSEPTAPTCWDYCTPFLFILSMAASLMSTVPMGRVTFIWQNRAGRTTFPICPLFAASRSRDSWGQHDSPACYLTTFLPVAPLAVALCMCVYMLAAVVYADRRRQRRSVAGDVTVMLTSLATTACCMAQVALLTDGVRNTCFGFQVEDFEYEGKVRMSSFNEVLTCRQGFDTKDRDHMVTGVDTYGQLMTAMVGSWLNAVVWLSLLFVACRRSCHWCGSGGGVRRGPVPIRVVRRRSSVPRFRDEFPEVVQQRRESWV